MNILIRYFLLPTLLFPFLGASFATAGDNDFYSEEVPYEPKNKFTKMLDAYSKEQKIQVIKKSASAGIAGGVFRKQWDLIDEIEDPEIATIHAMAAREPFHKKIVDVLEKLYPKADDEETRFQMALFLYRYKRKPGKDYLIKLLREQKSDFAAVILAENREEDALEDLKIHFNRILQSGKRVPVRLIWGLGRFGHQTDEILSKGLLKEKNKGDYLIALCLGRHTASPDGKAILRVRAQNRTGGTSKGGQFFATVTLLNMYPENKPFQESFFSFFDNLEELRYSEWFPIMQVLARHRIQLDRTSKIFEQFIQKLLDDKDPYPHTDGFEIDAVRFLLKTRYPKAVSLAFSLLDKIEKNPQFYSGYRYAISQALVAASSDPETDRRLDALLGKGTAKYYRKINQLNIVPPEFLPDSNILSSILERYISPDEFVRPPDIPKPDKKGFRNIQREKFRDYVKRQSSGN